MISERKIYFAKPSFYKLIRELGGNWNDTKERPIVCLLKLENSSLYWAIPMGNREYRDEKAKERILQYLNRRKLLQELEYKLKRILMFEDKRNNYFRQHITELKNFLEKK